MATLALNDGGAIRKPPVQNTNTTTYTGNKTPTAPASAQQATTDAQHKIRAINAIKQYAGKTNEEISQLTGIPLDQLNIARPSTQAMATTQADVGNQQPVGGTTTTTTGKVGTPATPGSQAPDMGFSVNPSTIANQQIEAGLYGAGLADPFASQRAQYQQQLQQLMTDPNAALANDPTFQFEKQQGIDAINANAAATGGLGSGKQLTDLEKFGTGLAAETIQSREQTLAKLAGVDSSSPAAAAQSYMAGAQGAAGVWQDVGNLAGMLLQSLFGGGGAGGLGGLLGGAAGGLGDLLKGGASGLGSLLSGAGSGLGSLAHTLGGLGSSGLHALESLLGIGGTDANTTPNTGPAGGNFAVDANGNPITPGAGSGGSAGSIVQGQQGEAFNPNTGQQLNYDQASNSWVDPTTGEVFGTGGQAQPYYDPAANGGLGAWVDPTTGEVSDTPPAGIDLGGDVTFDSTTPSDYNSYTTTDVSGG